MKLGFCLFGVLVICSFIASANEIDQKFLRSRTKECNEFINTLPKEIIKGFVTVPENPESPNGHWIKIFFYGKLSTNKNQIVFFNGGPSASSHNSFRSLVEANNNDALKKQFPFIFIDQRGTGCSDQYPAGEKNETIERLTYYGSRNIVFDAEFVRKELIGNRPWIVFGQSYGAYIVHRYFIMFPNSIVSAHAHGNAINSDPFNRLYNRVLSQQEVMSNYYKFFPEDEKKLSELRELLSNDVCFKDKNSSEIACGMEVLSPLVEYLGFKDTWEQIHDWINGMILNDSLNRSFIEDFLKEEYFQESNTDEQDVSIPFDVISLTDRNTIGNTYKNCTKVYEKAKSNGLNPDEFYINQCNFPLVRNNIQKNASTETLISSLPINFVTLEDFRNSLKKNDEIKFYLYSGQKDAYVPPSNFQEELNSVGDLIIYKNFVNSGHEGFRTEEQVWMDISSHL